MAEMETTVRNYKDLFSFKDMTLNTLVPKYFPNEEISTLNVGMLGLTSEQIGVTTEDAFNTISVLVKEFFPNRASLPESIYTYAGLFQLNAYKGQAAACKFLLVFSEDQVNEIFDQYQQKNENNSGTCIYLAKETSIFVEGLKFTLDYDIEITRRSTRLNTGKYQYGAKYVINNEYNSISNIISPYIKIRRTVNEYLALEVIAHQCDRKTVVSRIVDNTNVNYPIIDIQFNNVLAGFDVFYRENDNENWTQLDTKILNSLPQQKPFCYYSMANTNVLRISFSTADSYFQPEFNSEIKVIIYSCKGADGNFDEYKGGSISIVGSDERFPYNENFILAAKPVTSCTGGANSMQIEELRRLVIESFSTSNAITTDNDLEIYFNNYELRFDNLIRFIKRRDDQAYRLYTGFLIMKNDDYVYPTNTLDASVNYLDWFNPDGGYLYTLDPGYLFKYESVTNNRVVPIFRDGLYTKKVLSVGDSYTTTTQYLWGDYFKWLKSLDPGLLNPDDKYALSFIDLYDESTWVAFKKPDLTFRYFLENHVCFCPECKYAANPDDGVITTVDVDVTDYDQEITPEMYGNNTWFSFNQDLAQATFIGDGLNRYNRFISDGTAYNPLDDNKVYVTKFVCPICGYVGMEEGTHIRDFMINVFDTADVNELNKKIDKMTDTRNKFLFSNPFLISITKHPGLVSYYSTIIKQDSLVDFMDYNNEAPMQFILNQVHVRRPLNKNKEYTVTATILPSIRTDVETFVPGISTPSYVGKRTKTDKNYVRLFFAIEAEGEDCCMMEMVPTMLNEDDQIVFECKFKTSDHVTNGNKMQLEDYTDEELGYHPSEWLPKEDVIVDDEGTTTVVDDGTTNTFLSFDAGESLATYVGDNLNSHDRFISNGTSPWDEGDEEEEEPEEDNRWDESNSRGNFTYITNANDHLIPMCNINARIYIITKEYNVEDQYLVTNNHRDDPLKFKAPLYVWTNVYDTHTERLDFIKPLNMIRSSIYFRDDRLAGVDTGDCYVYSIPFLKHTLMTHYNTRGELTINETGYTNYEMFTYLFDKFMLQYNHMNEILSTVIRNASHVDMKFYNTYGRSKNYIIGDDDQIIDRVNMSICFHVYLISGTDFIKASDELKTFIKDQVEQINEFGSNDLNISNLMRKVEVQFPYVDHMKFAGFNGKVENENYITSEVIDEQIVKYGYSTDYQTIRNITSDLSDLDKDSRFAYVPEMLCLNKDQIALVLYEM